MVGRLNAQGILVLGVIPMGMRLGVNRKAYRIAPSSLNSASIAHVVIQHYYQEIQISRIICEDFSSNDEVQYL